MPRTKFQSKRMNKIRNLYSQSAPKILTGVSCPLSDKKEPWSEYGNFKQWRAYSLMTTGSQKRKYLLKIQNFQTWTTHFQVWTHGLKKQPKSEIRKHFELINIREGKIWSCRTLLSLGNLKLHSHTGKRLQSLPGWSARNKLPAYHLQSHVYTSSIKLHGRRGQWQSQEASEAWQCHWTEMCWITVHRVYNWSDEDW